MESGAGGGRGASWSAGFPLERRQTICDHAGRVRGAGARLAEVLDGWIRELEAGNAPVRGALLKAHPDLT